MQVGVEEDPQHLGDGEDDLAMRNIQEKRLPHPLAPCLNALSVAGGAEPPGAAGKHNEPFLPAVGTPDPDEPAFRIAAVKITLDSAHAVADGIRAASSLYADYIRRTSAFIPWFPKTKPGRASWISP